MKMWILIILSICCLQHVQCQEIGRIETDRPDQTECPFIVKKGYIQAEIGFNQAVSQNDRSYLLPTSLIKYGLHKNWELRYTSTISTSVPFHPVFQTESMGFKVHLFSGEKSILPRTALIVQYHWDNDNRDLSEKNKVPHSIGETIFTFQNNWTEKLGIGYNFGAEYHSNGKVEGIYRIAPNMNIGKRGYAYVELFGRFPASSDTEQWGDFGLAYYLSEDVKIDFSAGKSIRSNSEWYAALGCSFRMKVKP
ncbi:transporter [Aquirufa sp. ROCK2-A2]